MEIGQTDIEEFSVILLSKLEKHFQYDPHDGLESINQSGFVRTQLL